MKETLNLSKSTTTSSGAEMIMLSKDVMMDIFSRLRAKTLCRLRCVCKQWRSLISDPFFKSLHRARSSLKPSLLFLEQKCCSTSTTRVVDAKCPYMLRWCGVLVENSFYWIRHRNKYDSIEVIISFDLEKEDFGTVIPPKDTFDDGGLWSLAELMGMLWLFGSPEDISTMDIWVLKDSKNYMWAKEYTIDLAGFNFGVRFISILDHKEGKILMDVDSEILEWYDVDNKCFERVDNLSGAVHGNGCKSDWGRGRLVLSTNCWKISLYHPKFCFQLIDMRICVEPLKLI
ncbi:putative F-box protein At2g19630 isoform X3 [Nicotiana sylvestris]|uniref:F-box protein At2g19630 isoform X4 n=1 Tax=Nicotiana sylvestris TaxID=4096 RepID=A0A1U7V1L2_NICSY|nr:PREDICTED: putative F-box protein At2g19630 isoform X4 [Nicotiana sylvestris]